MRALHVIPAVAPRYGGPSHAVVGMTRALQDQHVNVLIGTTDADGQQRLPVQLGTPTDWQGVPTIFFPREFSEAWKFSRPFARWLDAQIATFDLVHIHAVFSHACVAAARASRRRGVPYIVRPLGTLDPWSMRQKPLRKRIAWHLGVGRMLRGAAAIHYTTATERRLAESSLNLQHGVVIPIGVDDATFSGARVADEFRQHWPALRSDPYLLVLGRLHPKKAVDQLLDVFLDTTSDHEHAHWRLVLAGDGEPAYVARLQQHVRERRAEQRVVFTGWVSGQQKLGALQGAALLILASQQENFGIVVAEALACGTPVLLSDQVNLADEVTAAGAGWVSSLEPTALRACLREALDSEQERVRRGSNGRRLALTEFRWERISQQLESLYRAHCHRSDA